MAIDHYRLARMKLQQRVQAAQEALVGSAGILLAGFLTIPLAAHVSGAHVTVAQGVSMSVMFFFTRWIWLFLVRLWFSRSGK